MSFKLEINTNNSAFDDEDMGLELGRILSEVAEKLDGGEFRVGADVPVYDVNGNSVGRWELTPND